MALTGKIARDDQNGIYCPKCGSWNLSEWENCSNCVAPLPKRRDLKELVPIFISICALAVSLYAIYQSGITLHASVQPLLDTYISDFHDHKALVLHNYGLGPAVITNVTFYNNTTKSIPINLPNFKLS